MQCLFNAILLAALLPHAATIQYSSGPEKNTGLKNYSENRPDSRQNNVSKENTAADDFLNPFADATPVSGKKQDFHSHRVYRSNKAADKKYRSFDHHTYEIIDTSYFIVYYRQKAVEKIANKGVMMVDQYYFSKTPDDDIYELSIPNLKKSFPVNHHFHYALDAQFRSDRELMDYDGYLKKYKLKYIFSQSLN